MNQSEFCFLWVGRETSSVSRDIKGLYCLWLVNHVAECDFLLQLKSTWSLHLDCGPGTSAGFNRTFILLSSKSDTSLFCEPQDVSTIILYRCTCHWHSHVDFWEQRLRPWQTGKLIPFCRDFTSAVQQHVCISTAFDVWLTCLLQIYVDTEHPERTISHNDAKVIVKKLISGLHHQGLRSGDVVCVHSSNSVSPLFP